MVQATTLPRNEGGIKAAVEALSEKFGDRMQTGQALREHHHLDREPSPGCSGFSNLS